MFAHVTVDKLICLPVVLSDKLVQSMQFPSMFQKQHYLVKHRSRKVRKGKDLRLSDVIHVTIIT